MLEIKPQGNIVERIVRTKTGEFVFAVFYVEESEEGLRVRLLSVRPISDSAQAKNNKLQTAGVCLYLPGKCPRSPAVIAYRKKYTSTVSPFSSLFEFFVSQPTRAPSF
ncbi:MAG: hypothetical protein NUV54_01625 [Candidatus Taylorbacteria bacterium]|nr:hypothetical protein [Candidatus Taylorbacteria bacterium]